MRLGIVLALVAAALAHECHVGNLVVENDAVISKSVEQKSCNGLCRRETLSFETRSIVLMNCDENKISNIINAGNECDVHTMENCYCEKELCNAVEMKENIIKPDDGEVAATNTACYVGYYASDAFSVGDLVACSSWSTCAKVNGTVAAGASNYLVEVYACLPNQVCNTLFPGVTSGTSCGAVNASATITGCCCYDADCSGLMNPQIMKPTPHPWDMNNITCYQGITVNGQVITGDGFYPCQGDCASARIRTTYNNQTIWGEVFTCDPSNIFTSIGVNNQCTSFNTANVTGSPIPAVITGCACSYDKCIDPTVVPPVYPIRQLKCYTGLANGTGSAVGAEMPCNGRCGRIRFYVGSTKMAYYMCAPWSVCAGFGMAATEGVTYNPPQDEEIEAYCCSATDNCNVDPNDGIVVNTTYLSTATYPVICYGGIWVNGQPITNAAYGLCQGECSSASFQTTFAGMTHNATIYTCDPVSMCSAYGIKNSCGQIANNVTGCCCDYDTCLDPTRSGPPPTLRCYSGISVQPDNYNQGGDQFCTGMCSSLSTIVNGKNVTTYWCAPFIACRSLGLGLGGNDNCAPIVGADPPVTGCCCADSDNCNAPPGVNITAIPARNEPPITCFEGFYLNGQNYSANGYRVCRGQCVSIMLTGMVNSTSQYGELFTCDPSSACASLGLNNNCSTIDGTVTGCCCDSDACIDPTIGRRPGGPTLQCYVGLLVQGSMNYSAGAIMNCPNGNCATISTTVAGNPTASFHCVPSGLCKSLGLSNSMGVITLDRDITGVCCDNAQFCNINGYPTINVTGMTPSTERPRACYSGIFVNGVLATDGGWVACQGDCVSVGINTTLSGSPQSAVVYTCDPTSVCRQMGTQNNCTTVEPGLEACCCDTDACIDPTASPPKKPGVGNNVCYVGVYNKDYNITLGQSVSCIGTCASLTSSINNSITTAFACVPNYVCSYLALYDNCASIYSDRLFTACCCSNGANCNSAGFNVPATPTPLPVREYPITCPAGVVVDGMPVTPIQFTACTGDCASVTINSTVNGTLHAATVYTCDPSNVCRQLNALNTCVSPEPGLTGCCCDTDACIDPTRNKTSPTNPLLCYVGVYSNATKTGNTIVCNGKCASLSATVGGDNATVYACVPHSFCRSIQLYDTCNTLTFDRAITGCCCDNYNQCNIDLAGNPVNSTNFAPTLRDYPIVCYSGMFVNSTPVTAGSWQACNGDCSSITLNTTWMGQSATASLYGCDPVSVCRNLNLINNCSTIEPGLGGCCCTTDQCLDPTKNPPRTPLNPLYCYVGVQSAFNNMSVGAQVLCPGKCSSLSGIVGNYSTTTYHCVPSQICATLELQDRCRNLPGDRAITGCCCDNYSNCNINGTNIVPPSPSPNVDYPLACYSGIYVNGSAITPVSLSVCNGQCTSISLSTTYNGVAATATLYTCDPSSVCNALNMSNACASPEPGLTGCCCDSDACINPFTGAMPGNQLMCFVGVYAAYNNFVTGSQVACNGKCASLETKYNNNTVKTYHCSPTALCKKLDLNNACNKMQTDRDITACCCDNGNNCNVKENLGANATQPTPPFNGTTIACYSGIYIGNTPYITPAYVPCQGSCSSVTYSTGPQNSTVLTLYTCDPTSVCQGLNLSNSCSTIDGTGLSGCCCNTDVCVAPGVTPTTTSSTASALLSLLLLAFYALVRQ